MMFEASMLYGHGVQEESRETAGPLGGVERDGHHSGALVLRAAEYHLERGEFDQRVGARCRKYYKSSSGRPSITPGTYFRMLLFGLLRGHRIRAGSGVERGRFAELPPVSGLRAERTDAGSFDGIAHQAAVLGLDTSRRS